MARGPGRRERSRFRGLISGVGSTSGIRIVLGHWLETPLGRFSDAMVELADGHRLLLAEDCDVARFVAATYDFDEIRIEPFAVHVDGPRWQVRSSSLHLDLTIGRRTWIGWVLCLVPRRVAEAPWWCSVTDVPARLLLSGVRTKGAAGRDRREWYGATDNRRIVAMTGSFLGEDLGSLAPVEPPATFGFSSPPRRPSLTHVVSTVEFSPDAGGG